MPIGDSGSRWDQITLAVLAGGEGSRMGRPKGLIEIDGRPILTHLLTRFDWPGPTLLITAPGRENPPGWESFDHEATDPVAGEGPLRGVLTALENAGTDRVLIATVDMPAIAHENLCWLARAMTDRSGPLGLILQRGEGQDASIEPFPSLFRREAADVIRERLGTGRRAVHGLAQDARFAVIDAPSHWPATVWTNLNHPADLAAYLETM